MQWKSMWWFANKKEMSGLFWARRMAACSPQLNPKLTRSLANVQYSPANSLLPFKSLICCWESITPGLVWRVFVVWLCMVWKPECLLRFWGYKRENPNNFFCVLFYAKKTVAQSLGPAFWLRNLTCVERVGDACPVWCLWWVGIEEEQAKTCSVKSNAFKCGLMYHRLEWIYTRPIMYMHCFPVGKTLLILSVQVHQ